jgi:hypothetical protein
VTAPRDYADIHGTTLDPVYLEYLEWVEELRDELASGPSAL